MEFSSKGVGNAGLTTGIIGTALGVLNGGIPNLIGGIGGNRNAGCCNENMPVNRYEAAQNARIAELETEVKLRDSTIYTDSKILEVYKNIDEKLGIVNQKLCDQAVWNASQSANINCLATNVAALNALTKMVIPAANVCPAPMPQYNSWTAPTTTT